MSPLNYASDDEGYRSSHSVMSGTSTPDPFVRSKSGSDPKNPNQTILSKLTRRGIDFSFEFHATCRLQSASLFIQRPVCFNMLLYFVVKKLRRGNICYVVFMFDPPTILKLSFLCSTQISYYSISISNFLLNTLLIVQTKFKTKYLHTSTSLKLQSPAHIATVTPCIPSLSALPLPLLGSGRSQGASTENLIAKENMALNLNLTSTNPQQYMKQNINHATSTAITNMNSHSNTKTNSKQKKRIKASVAAVSFYYWDSLEWLMTLVIVNFCFYLSLQRNCSLFMFCCYVALGNFVIGRTLFLRSGRVPDSYLNSQTEKEVESSVNIKKNSAIIMPSERTVQQKILEKAHAAIGLSLGTRTKTKTVFSVLVSSRFHRFKWYTVYFVYIRPSETFNQSLCYCCTLFM
jgi:hypothetical protein